MKIKMYGMVEMVVLKWLLSIPPCLIIPLDGNDVT